MLLSGKRKALLMVILLQSMQTQAILLPLLMGLAVIPQLFTTTDHLEKTTTTTTTTAAPPPMEWNLFWREEIFRRPAPSTFSSSWEKHGTTDTSSSDVEKNNEEKNGATNATLYDAEKNNTEKHEAVTNNLSDVKSIREHYQEFREYRKDGLRKTKEKVFSIRMSPFARRLRAFPDPPIAM